MLHGELFEGGERVSVVFLRQCQSRCLAESKRPVMAVLGLMHKPALTFVKQHRTPYVEVGEGSL